ncbi:MAG: hypothetical protein ACR2ID_06795 [Chthoniobacterales bacterium]
MNTPQNPVPRPPRMSPEAALGTGITFGALGVLFLLLGWAQSLREVRSASTTLLLIGAVLVALGLFVILVTRAKKNA